MRRVGHSAGWARADEKSGGALQEGCRKGRNEYKYDKEDSLQIERPSFNTSVE